MATSRMMKGFVGCVILALLGACSSSKFTGSVDKKIHGPQPAPTPCSGGNCDQKPKVITDIDSSSADFGCTLTAQPASVVPGLTTQVTMQVTGNPTSASIDGKAVAATGGTITVTPTKTVTISGKVSTASNSKTCEVAITLLPAGTAADPNSALCAHDKGKGRKILMINTYAGENFPAFLNTDASDMKAATGIEFQIMNLYVDATAATALTAVQAGNYDGIWFFSNQILTPGLDQLYATMRQQSDTGKGLAIFGDNDPYTADATQFFATAFPEWGIKLTGYYQAQGVVSLPGLPSDGKGQLFQHAVTSGIFQSVSEGITVSHLEPTKSPSIMDKPEFSKVLVNTEGKLSVAAVQSALPDAAKAYANAAKDASGKPVRRVVIHAAFTELFHSQGIGIPGYEGTYGWDNKKSPGTPQFFENIACWTANAQ